MNADGMEVYASNIGGIDETTVTVPPGVTVLEGRNATNRTSFLEAVMAGFGSRNVRLKGDADEGRVELTIGGDTYERTLTRENGHISFDGDPYLDDPTVVDLFGFLLETNEARQAIARGDDLREIIMEPVDTGEIQAQIRHLEEEKRDVDQEIEAIEDELDRLPTLEERLRKRRDEIADKESALAEKEQEIDELDRGMEETRQEKDELEDTLSALRSARSDLESLQYDIGTEQESLESLREEREELQEEQAETDELSDDRITQLDDELDRLRNDRQALESEISTLQQVIQFNEEMLEGTSTDIATALQGTDTATDGGVTDQLVEREQSVVCWTCGSEAETAEIEETIDRLQDLLSEKHSDLQAVESDIDDRTAEKKSLESQRREARKVERRLEAVETEIGDREETIEHLRDRTEAKRDEIERLEAQADEQENEEYSEILEVHREANELEFELDRLRSEAEDIEAEIDQIERRAEEQEVLESRREDISEQLTELRTRIDRLEQDAVDEFNTHMDEILGILEYANIERIWLERTTREVPDGRQTVSQSAFDLHVVRVNDDGATYEDTVDHLSESEREVTGLIFALAGYLTHDVYEHAPVILLDSLEAVDSERIAEVVEYFGEYAEYLLVALLPEDAQALDGSYERITDI